MTDPIRVAILHYHLRPGGVTRVIQQALSALKDRDVRLAVISGEQAESDLPHAVIEDLGYHTGASSFSIPDIAANVRAAAEEALGGPPDIWHIHNHCLGKNLTLPLLTRYLADEKQRLVLQIHDFAEDGRPGNYHFLAQHLADGSADPLSKVLYPAGEHVHYALLNGRDAACLSAAGLAAEQSHLLANAAWIGGEVECDAATVPGLFVYPTRAIRRKNLGEFLLWSAAAEEGSRFAVTMAPENPVERPRYEEWVAFANNLNLPVNFEAGRDQADFRSFLRSAEGLVTTSIAEGFGLAFLEPWLAGRPLYGRNLPEITSGFEKAGVDLSGLYDQLSVPKEWIDLDGFRRKMEEGMQSSFEAYGRELTPIVRDAGWDSVFNDDGIEFSKLDEELQRSVIERVADGGACEMNPALLTTGTPAAIVEANRQAVRDVFGIEAYGDRLMNLYGQVLTADTQSSSHLDGTRLLDEFMSPERFTLLRT